MPTGKAYRQMQDKRESRAGELHGWEAIAKFLGVTRRTAHNYERDRGLPIHRLPGEKAPVWAYTEELTAWKNGSPIEAIEMPAATDVAAAPQPITAAAEPTSLRPLKVGFPLWPTLLIAATLLVIICSWRLGRPHSAVQDYQVTGRTVIAFDRSGQELWRRDLGAFQAEARYTHPDRAQMGTTLSDPIHGIKLLLVTEPLDRNRAGNDLLCFSNAGELEWRFRTDHFVRDASGVMSPPFLVAGVIALARRGNRDSRIIVSSYHYLEQADQVAVLDINGKLLAEYWHPGHLLYLVHADVTGSGHDQVLLGGVNNGNHQATLVVLDPWKMSGVSTPTGMADQRFRLLDKPAAHEQAVVFFPRSSVSTTQPYTRVLDLRVLPGHIMVTVAEGPAEATAPQLVYELNYGLQVIHVETTESFRLAYNALTHSQASSQVLQAECERLKSAVVVCR